MVCKLLTICMTSIFCVRFVAGDYCYNEVIGACSRVGEEVQNCNAKYGAFKEDELLVNMQGYANSHILHSFQFLLMSSHFGNFKTNRGGFEKLYRQLSDHTWKQAIDLVKFIGKRGGYMNFHVPKYEDKKQLDFEMYELESMAKALDIQKNLAENAYFIHAEVTRKKEHDPEVASYLEKKFVYQHSNVIRKLSGHTNDLKHLIGSEPDPSLALYLFDEYLQKSLLDKNV